MSNMSQDPRRPMYDEHLAHHRRSNRTRNCTKQPIDPKKDLRLVNDLMPWINLEDLRAKVQAAWEDGEIAEQHYERLDILLTHLLLRNWPEPMVPSEIDPRYLPLLRWLLLSYSDLSIWNLFVKHIAEYIRSVYELHDDQIYSFMPDRYLSDFHDEIRYFVQIIEQNIQFERYGGPTRIRRQDQDDLVPYIKIFGLSSITLQKMQYITTLTPERIRRDLASLLDDIHNVMRRRRHPDREGRQRRERRPRTNRGDMGSRQGSLSGIGPEETESRYGSVSGAGPEGKDSLCGSVFGECSPEAEEDRRETASGTRSPESDIPSQKLFSKDVRDTISQLEDVLFKAMNLAKQVILQVDEETSASPEESSSSDIKTETDESKVPEIAETNSHAGENVSEAGASGLAEDTVSVEHTPNNGKETSHNLLNLEERDSSGSGSTTTLTATSLSWNSKDDKPRKDSYFAFVEEQSEAEEVGNERGRSTSPREITHHEQNKEE